MKHIPATSGSCRAEKRSCRVCLEYAKTEQKNEPPPPLASPVYMSFYYATNIDYKIANIVRALWLAERRVCMRLCKHGCDVKMFCFSRANHVSTNLKKFLSSKLDKVTLFTRSFVDWNLENLYKQTVSIFFAKADILSQKNPYFGKHLFAKQELITRSRLRVQDFGTGKNFCFNQYHNKEFLSFFSGKLFYKSNRKLFPVFA